MSTKTATFLRLGPTSSLVVAMAVLTLSLAGVEGCHSPARSRPRSSAVGRVLILPGITNTEFEAASLRDLIQKAHPDWDVEIIPWGPPLMAFDNLGSYKRNMRTARRLAEDVALYRRGNPEAAIHLVGVSGGGGMACFVIESLPDDVSVNRLILIAPAISRGYRVETKVLPKVSEFAVNYMSSLDLQVSLGTRVFGTMDRRNTESAGFQGFTLDHPKLIQVPWVPEMMMAGHFGNHMSYLSKAWQECYVLPALTAEATIDKVQTLATQKAN